MALSRPTTLHLCFQDHRASLQNGEKGMGHVSTDQNTGPQPAPQTRSWRGPGPVVSRQGTTSRVLERPGYRLSVPTGIGSGPRGVGASAEGRRSSALSAPRQGPCNRPAWFHAVTVAKLRGAARSTGTGAVAWRARAKSGDSCRPERLPRSSASGAAGSFEGAREEGWTCRWAGAQD